VTSTLVLEGNGRVQEYVGGYDDWQRQCLAAAQAAGDIAPGGRAEAGGRPNRERSRDAGRLSYRERREFEELPASIEALEAEQRDLNATVESPEFYKAPAATIALTLARLDELRIRLDALYERWDALDSRS
jgi:ATP-binding cassette subfamily F protein uup